jgi:hypothetical protein
MKKADVEIGAIYIAKVSDKLARVRITGESPYGGWNAVNQETGRAIHIRGAQRLRRKWVPKADGWPASVRPGSGQRDSARRQKQ